MKYVALIRPLDDFKEYTLNVGRRYGQYIDRKSSLGDHCTLMVGQLHETAERALVAGLEKIAQEQFAAELTGELALFEGLSLVARLKRTPALQNLHLQIVEQARHCIDWAETGMLPQQYKSDPDRAKAFWAYGSANYGQFYNPHITLGHVREGLLRDAKLVKDGKLVLNMIPAYAWTVFDIELVKKQGDKWKPVRKIQLR